MSELVGGPGALIAILAPAKEFVLLEFGYTVLTVKSVSRTYFYKSQLNLVSPQISSGCVRVKDLIDALYCCYSKTLIGFESERLVVSCSEESSIDFRCEIKTIDPEIVLVNWNGIGSDITSIGIDTEVLLTALSQVYEKMTPVCSLSFSQDGIQVSRDSSCRVHIPCQLIQILAGQPLQGVTVNCSMKDVQSLVGFLGVLGDVKTVMTIGELGLKFERKFFCANLAIFELLTAGDTA